MSKHESAWTIPQDWLLPSGQWTCYKILWPESSAWHFLLSGVLYSLSRGREWDAETGTVKDAQAVGLEIFERNYPLVLCGDVEPCEEYPPEPQNGTPGGSSDIGVGEMPCIDISSMLKIENGVLYARNSCCEWVSIGAIAGLNEGVPDDPVNPNADPNFVYSACGKAKAIVDIAYLIVAAGFSALADTANPFKWIPYIESTAGYDLDNNYLAGMLAEITAGLTLETAQFPFGVEASDVDDPIEHQRILCRVVREFSDDAIGVDADKFAAVKACFKAEMFPFSLWYGMFDYALNALGKDDMNTVAKWGAGNTTADCQCPDEQLANSESEPDVDGWYLGVDRHDEVTYHVDAGNANALALWTGTPPEDAYGVWMKLNIPASGLTAKRMSQTAMLTAFPGVFTEQDLTVFADTSDHLEAVNQLYPVIQLNSQPIAVSLAAAMGITGFTRLTGGIDGVTIATPEWLVANSGALCITSEDETLTASITELRWIHNTNSPSHA